MADSARAKIRWPDRLALVAYAILGTTLNLLASAFYVYGAEGEPPEPLYWTFIGGLFAAGGCIIVAALGAIGVGIVRGIRRLGRARRESGARAALTAPGRTVAADQASRRRPPSRALRRWTKRLLGVYWAAQTLTLLFIGWQVVRLLRVENQNLPAEVWESGLLAVAVPMGVTVLATNTVVALAAARVHPLAAIPAAFGALWLYPGGLFLAARGSITWDMFWLVTLLLLTVVVGALIAGAVVARRVAPRQGGDLAAPEWAPITDALADAVMDGKPTAPVIDAWRRKVPAAALISAAAMTPWAVRDRIMHMVDSSGLPATLIPAGDRSPRYLKPLPEDDPRALARQLCILSHEARSAGWSSLLHDRTDRLARRAARKVDSGELSLGRIVGQCLDDATDLVKARG
jgi:hypothetical protein